MDKRATTRDISEQVVIRGGVTKDKTGTFLGPVTYIREVPTVVGRVFRWPVQTITFALVSDDPSTVQWMDPESVVTRNVPTV